MGLPSCPPGTCSVLQGALISHRNLICVYASGKVLEVEQVRHYMPYPHSLPLLPAARSIVLFIT